MPIPLRQEYHSNLAKIRGWLAIFCGFVFLSFLAFLRSALAEITSGKDGALLALIISALILVAWVGLLRRKRWAYYLFLVISIFWLIATAVAIVRAPGQMLLKDWAFDLPLLGEFLITAAWLGYLLYSRRVYSFYFGSATT
jgi:hypothetical protein